MASHKTPPATPADRDYCPGGMNLLYTASLERIVLVVTVPLKGMKPKSHRAIDIRPPRKPSLQ
ncbi:hypothetical protein RAB80_002954 [Fusarium oxysporum f. sp. vasinfectum]|nr:hypothetical protein RAB80_002954 [Fusarium oxysporum f. sp. vasinfectum]KAK2934404.1 hypothetical protein FoTM2_005651 [Fusarium oxysporum f. sp. vasinfectum]